MSEIEKLKEWLVKKQIPIDLSYSDSCMTRIRFVINGMLHSAISGQYSYGGDQGLIEVYTPGNGKVEGWMTAESVINMIENELKGNVE